MYDYVYMKRDSSLLPPVPAASPWIPSPQNPHRGYSFRSQGMRRTWPQQSPNVSTLEAMAKPIYSFRIVVCIYIYIIIIYHILYIHTYFLNMFKLQNQDFILYSCIKPACEPPQNLPNSSGLWRMAPVDQLCSHSWDQTSPPGGIIGM